VNRERDALSAAGGLGHADGSVAEPIAARRNVRIDSAPQVHTPTAIDEDHLVQVVVNLLENAVKHGREGGQIVVSSAVLANRCVAITVDDDGPGVRPEALEKIFQRHARMAKAAREGMQALGLKLFSRSPSPAMKSWFYFDSRRTGPLPPLWSTNLGSGT